MADIMQFNKFSDLIKSMQDIANNKSFDKSTRDEAMNVVKTLTKNAVLTSMVETAFGHADAKSAAAAKRMAARQPHNDQILNQIDKVLDELHFGIKKYSYNSATGSIDMFVSAAKGDTNPVKLSIPVGKNNEFIRNHMNQNGSLAVDINSNGEGVLSGPTEQYLRSFLTNLRELKTQIKSGKVNQNSSKSLNIGLKQAVEQVAHELSTLSQSASYAMVDNANFEHGANSQSRQLTMKGLTSVRNAIRQIIKQQSADILKHKAPHDRRSDQDILSRLEDKAWQYLAIYQTTRKQALARQWSKDEAVGLGSDWGQALLDKLDHTFADFVQIRGAIGFGSDESLSRGVMMLRANQHRTFEGHGDPTRHGQQTENIARRSKAAAEASKYRELNNLITQAGKDAQYDYSAPEEHLYKVAYVTPEKMAEAWNKVVDKVNKHKSKYIKQYQTQVEQKLRQENIDKNLGLTDQQIESRAQKIAKNEIEAGIKAINAPSIHDDMSVMGNDMIDELESERLRSFTYIRPQHYKTLQDKAIADWNKNKDKYLKQKRFAGMSTDDARKAFIDQKIIKSVVGKSIRNLGDYTIQEKYIDENDIATLYYDVQAREIMKATEEAKVLGDLTGSRTTANFINPLLKTMLLKELGVEQGTNQLRLAKEFKTDAIPGLARGMLSRLLQSKQGNNFRKFLAANKGSYNFANYVDMLFDKDWVFQNSAFNEALFGKEDNAIPYLYKDLVDAMLGFEKSSSNAGGAFFSGLAKQNDKYVLNGNAFYINDVLGLPDTFDWNKDVRVSKREMEAMQRTFQLSAFRSGKKDPEKELSALNNYLFGDTGLFRPTSAENKEAMASQVAIASALSKTKFSGFSSEDIKKIGWHPGAGKGARAITIGNGSQYTIDLSQQKDLSPSWNLLHHGNLSEDEFNSTLYGQIYAIREQMIQSGIDPNMIDIIMDPQGNIEFKNPYFDPSKSSKNGSDPNYWNSIKSDAMFLPYIAPHKMEIDGENFYQGLPFQSELTKFINVLRSGRATPEEMNEAAGNLLMGMYGHGFANKGSYYDAATSRRIPGSFSPHITGIAPTAISQKGLSDKERENLISSAWVSRKTFERMLNDAEKRDEFSDKNDYYEALRNMWSQQTGRSNWDDTKFKSLNSKISNLKKAIMRNAENGMGVFGQLWRYPSIEGTDVKNMRLFIGKGIREGNMRVGAGLAKNFAGDFDGDTVNFLLGLSKNPEVLNQMAELVNYDTNVSKRLYSIYEARGDIKSGAQTASGSTDPFAIMSEQSLLNASDDYRAAIIGLAAKINKQHVGVFSNMSTNLRNALTEAKLDEASLRSIDKAHPDANLQKQFTAAQFTRALFQSIEQDSISSKKVEDRLKDVISERAKNPNADITKGLKGIFEDDDFVGLFTQYSKISEKLLGRGEGGVYSQNEFFKDLTEMNLIKTNGNGQSVLATAGAAQAVARLLASGLFGDDDEGAIKEMARVTGMSEDNIRKGEIPIDKLREYFSITNQALIDKGKRSLPILPSGEMVHLSSGAYKKVGGSSVITTRDYNNAGKNDAYGLTRFLKNPLSAMTDSGLMLSNIQALVDPTMIPQQQQAPKFTDPKTLQKYGTTTYLKRFVLPPSKFASIQDDRMSRKFKEIVEGGHLQDWAQKTDEERAAEFGVSPQEYAQMAKAYDTLAYGTMFHAVAESYGGNNSVHLFDSNNNLIDDPLGRAQMLYNMQQAFAHSNINGEASAKALADQLKAQNFVEDFYKTLGFEVDSNGNFIDDSNLIAREMYIESNPASGNFKKGAPNSKKHLIGQNGQAVVSGIADIITKEVSDGVTKYIIGDWKTNASGKSTDENIWQNLLYQTEVLRMRDATASLASSFTGDRAKDAQMLAEHFHYNEFTDEGGTIRQTSQAQKEAMFDMLTDKNAQIGGSLYIADKHGTAHIIEIDDVRKLEQGFSDILDKARNFQLLTDEEINRLRSSGFIRETGSHFINFKDANGNSITREEYEAIFDRGNVEYQQRKEYLDYVAKIKSLYSEAAKREKVGLDASSQRQSIELYKKEADALLEKINQNDKFDKVYKQDIEDAKSKLEIAENQDIYGQGGITFRQHDYERAQGEMLHSELAIADAQRRMGLTSNSVTLQSLETIVDAEKRRLEYLQQQVEEKGKLLTDDQKAAADAKYQLNKDAALAQQGARNGGSKNIWDKFAMGLQNQLSRYFDFTLIYGSLRKLTAKIKEVIQTAIQLNQAATNIRVVTGKNKEEVDALMLSYTKLAKELGTTTSAVAQSANAWLRQGYSLEEANELIKTSTYLSKLGMLDMSTATKVLTSTMKGFKMEASESLSIVDKLTELDKHYAASAGEIGEALSRVASVAQGVNLGLDETASMIAIIMDVTQQEAGAVGTSLRSVLSRFSNVKAGKFSAMAEEDGDVDSLNDVEKVLKTIGIDVRSSQLEMRNFGDVLDDLAAKWEGLSNVERNAVATAMAGTRQRNAFQALMDNYDRYKEAVETSQNSEGTALTKWEAQVQSVEYALSQLKTAWEDLTQRIMNSDFIKGFYKIATFIVQSLPYALSSITSMLAALNAYKIPNFMATLGERFSFKRSVIGQSMRYGVDQYGIPRGSALGSINGSNEVVNAVVPYLKNIDQNVAKQSTGKALQSAGQEYGNSDYYTKGGRLRKYGIINPGYKTDILAKAESNEKDPYLFLWDKEARKQYLKEHPGMTRKSRREYLANNKEYQKYESEYKEQLKLRLGMAAAAGLGAGITGVFTSNSNKIGAIAKQINPSGMFARINDVQSDAGDMVANGVANGVATGFLTAIPGVGPIIGPILGPIFGDLIGGAIKAARHKDEIERAKNREEAQKQLDAVNKYQQDISNAQNAIGATKYSNFTSKEYAALDTLMSSAWDMFTDPILESSDNLEDFAHRIGLTDEDLAEMSKNTENAGDAFNTFSDKIITLVKSGALSPAKIAAEVAAEEAMIEYEAWEKDQINSEEYAKAENWKKQGGYQNAVNDLGALNEDLIQKNKEIKDIYLKDANLEATMATEFLLTAGLNYIQFDTNLHAYTDILTSQSKEKIKQVAAEMDAEAKRTFDKFEREKLSKLLNEYALNASGVAAMTTEELSNASFERVVYNIAKSLADSGKYDGVYNADGTVKSSVSNKIISILQSNDKYSGIGSSKNNRSIKELLEERDNANSFANRYAGGKTIEELKNIAFNEDQTGLREIARNYFGNKYDGTQQQLDRIGDIIASLNTTTLDNVTHSLLLTNDAMDKLRDKLGFLTEQNIQDGLQSLADMFSNINNIISDLTDNLSLSEDSINKLVKDIPFLLYNNQGNIDASRSNIMNNIAKFISGEDSALVQSYARLRASEMINGSSSSDVWKQFLGTTLFGDMMKDERFSSFETTLTNSDLISNVEQAYEYIRSNSAENGELAANEFMDAFASEVSNLIGDPGYMKQIDETLNSWISHSFQMEIDNLESIKDAMDNNNKTREDELKLIKAKEKLENAQNEKRRIYRAGIGFTYEADQVAINEAQAELEQLEREQDKQDIQYQIDLLKQQKDALEHIAENEKWKAVEDLYKLFSTPEGYKFNLDSQEFMNALTASVRDAISGDTTSGSGVSAVYTEKRNASVKDVVDALDKFNTDWTAGKNAGFNSKGNAAQAAKTLRIAEDSKQAYLSALDELKSNSANYSDEEIMAGLMSIDGMTQKKANQIMSDLKDYSGIKNMVATTKHASGWDMTADDIEARIGWSTKTGNFTEEGYTLSGIGAIRGDADFAVYKVNNDGSITFDWDHDVIHTEKKEKKREKQLKDSGLLNNKYLLYDKDHGVWYRWHGDSADNGYWDIFQGIGGESGYKISDQASGWFNGTVGYGDMFDTSTTNAVKFASGSYNTQYGAHLINELGTEGIITPQGTLTALPSHSGIVPADLTRNLYTLGEVAPTLIKRWSDPNNVKTNKQNNIEDNSMNVQNLYATFETDDGFDFEQLLIQARQYVANTKRNHT